MKILVFGANGQVAQSLAAISGDDLGVTCLGRPDGDITQADNITRAVDEAEPDVVINAAAYTAVDKAESEPDAAFAVNETGSANLARSCLSAGVPLIHFSTDYVYAGDKPEAYLETDPTGPQTVYGRSKLAGENAIRDILDAHVILRTAWVYSPYAGNFLKTMLRLAQDRDKVNVVDDQHGCPSYAPDLANASIIVARNILSRKNGYGLFHLSNRGATTWCGLAQEIFRRAKAYGVSCDANPIPTSQYPTPAERPLNSRLNCSKINSEHGVELPYWTDSIPTCLAQLFAQTPVT